MNLAQSYAQVIQDRGHDKHFLDQLLSHMKAKGHASLLPQVVRILERTPKKDATVVSVAKKEDVAKYKAGIEEALKAVSATEERELKIDPRLVGGYVVMGKGKAVDKSFRSALVSIYRSVVS